MKRKARISTLLATLFLVSPMALAQTAPHNGAPQNSQTTANAKTFSQQELDQLLAPIALYPDALLAQILMGATYPLEIVQAARWVWTIRNLPARRWKMPWRSSRGIRRSRR